MRLAPQVLSLHGVSAVTFAAVAAQAGYSRGIITHHFGSRRGLMEALARSVQELVLPAPAELHGRQRVLAQVDLYLATLQQHPRDTRVFAMLWAEAIAGDPDLRPIFAERDASFRSSFASALRHAVRTPRPCEHEIDGTGPTSRNPTSDDVFLNARSRFCSWSFRSAQA